MDRRRKFEEEYSYGYVGVEYNLSKHNPRTVALAKYLSGVDYEDIDYADVYERHNIRARDMMKKYLSFAEYLIDEGIYTVMNDAEYAIEGDGREDAIELYKNEIYYIYYTYI